jgi:hypothetical protein
MAPVKLGMLAGARISPHSRGYWDWGAAVSACGALFAVMRRGWDLKQYG